MYENTIQDGISIGGDQSSELKKEHSELHGRLLIANERLENVGTMLIWMMLLAVVGACVALHKAWLDPVFGIPVENLQGWGVYSLILLVAFVFYSIYNEVAEKMAYRRIHPSIENYLSQNGLSLPWLVSQIEGDESLSEVAEQLKKINF